RLCRDLCGELVRMAGVERHRDPAGMRNGEEADAPLWAVDSPEDRAIAWTEAGVGEHTRGSRHHRAEVAIAPGARAERGPDDERRMSVVPARDVGHHLDEVVDRVLHPSPSRALDSARASRGPR